MLYQLSRKLVHDIWDSNAYILINLYIAFITNGIVFIITNIIISEVLCREEQLQDTFAILADYIE